LHSHLFLHLQNHSSVGLCGISIWLEISSSPSREWSNQNLLSCSSLSLPPISSFFLLRR
ncbi:unnamed protein product, partial [Arabidopsis halleri]